MLYNAPKAPNYSISLASKTENLRIGKLYRFYQRKDFCGAEHSDRDARSGL